MNGVVLLATMSQRACGIAAASVLALAAGGRASMRCVTLSLRSGNRKAFMLQAGAKGELLPSRSARECAARSVHALRVDLGVCAET